MLEQLETIIENLRAKDEVDAVMLSGSYGPNRKSYSDIDLIIVLNENTESLKAVYTWIDGIFADIFVFDKSEVATLNDADRIPALDNKLHGCLYAWTLKGDIRFDKSGSLTALKSHTIHLEVSDDQKLELWQGINYNFEANSRYYYSGDPVYREALELRLMYSIPQMLTGYFAFRNIPWQGEKNALDYLKNHEIGLYQEFISFAHNGDIEHKFASYTTMVTMTMTNDYPLWERTEILPQPKDRPAGKHEARLTAYWKLLIS